MHKSLKKISAKKLQVGAKVNNISIMKPQEPKLSPDPGNKSFQARMKRQKLGWATDIWQMSDVITNYQEDYQKHEFIFTMVKFELFPKCVIYARAFT